MVRRNVLNSILLVRKIIIALLLVNCSMPICFGQLIINEIVSCNNNGITDSFGNTPDWIEIFNHSTEDIDMGDYYLSDKSSTPLKWQFPQFKLSSNEYLVIYASNENTNIVDELHTNFKIDADGETILLSKVDTTISQINVPAMACNFSYGYFKNYDSLVVFTQPSPGFPNYLNSIELPLQFSHEAGFYKDSFALSISVPTNAEIRYTINTATEPTKNSILYTNPFYLKNRKDEENIFSAIPTTDTTLWQKPKGEIFKINVVRAAAFINGERVSKVHTKSYGITPLGHQRYSFPIFSLVTEPHQFFSDSVGIYVLGDSYNINSIEPNFAFDWERDVFVEFFENDGQKVVDQKAEIEIAGQTTRWKRQKSLKLKASGKGNKERFEHSFFNSTIKEFRTLTLKSPFTDYRKSFIKDEFVNKLAEKIGLADTDCRPVIVFLNGEYWGIHILEEKHDKYYFKDHFGVDKDSIHLLQKNANEDYEIIEGSGFEYLQLRNYAVDNDLNEKQHFDYIAEHINIENYINYYCFNFLVANRDWPWNNIKYWRPIDHSRKWEWIPYDFDSSYNFPETDGFALASEPVNESQNWSVLLYNNLMGNHRFKSTLLFRLENLLNNEFCVDTIKPLIDEYKNYYEPEIEEHIHRWNFEDEYNWENEMDIYYKFPNVVAKVLKQIVKDDFNYDMFLCDSVITNINEITTPNDALFSVYPTPANNHINISYNYPYKIKQLYIYDIIGNIFLTVEGTLNHSKSINVSSLPAGIYYVKTVANNEKFALGKFIKLP